MNRCLNATNTRNYKRQVWALYVFALLATQDIEGDISERTTEATGTETEESGLGKGASKVQGDFVLYRLIECRVSFCRV